MTDKEQQREAGTGNASRSDTTSQADHGTSEASGRAGETFSRFRQYGPGGLGALLNEKERKTLLAYIALGVIIVEFVVTVVAILHGVTNMHALADGTMEYSFPWKAYLVAVFLAPVGVMFIIQIIGMGFSRIIHGDPEMADMTGEHVPNRMRRWVGLAQGIPTAILLAGLLLLGLVLYHMDMVMSFLLKLGETAAGLALWIVVGVFAVWLISYMARLWLMYRTRKMAEEYAFRREVLERTGIAIIDQKTAITADGRMLTPGGDTGGRTIDALPSALPPRSGGEALSEPSVRSLPPGTSPDE